MMSSIGLCISRGQNVKAKEIWPFGFICAKGSGWSARSKPKKNFTQQRFRRQRRPVNMMQRNRKRVDHRRQDREDRQMARARLLESIIVALQQEKVRQDRFDDPDQSYGIETRIEVSRQEWCFTCVVTLNGVEITDDPELTKETTCRKHVAQINTAKALWNLFVKEAATIHFDRCNAIRQRLEKSSPQPRTTKKRKTAMMATMAVLAGCVLCVVYLTRSPTGPTSSPERVGAPPPLTKTIPPLEKPEPVPPFEVMDRVAEAPNTIPPRAVAAQTTPVEVNPAEPDPLPVPAGSSDAFEPAPPTAAMDPLPEPVEKETADPQPAVDLSPEEIKKQIRSILENKTKTP